MKQRMMTAVKAGNVENVDLVVDRRDGAAWVAYFEGEQFCLIRGSLLGGEVQNTGKYYSRAPLESKELYDEEELIRQKILSMKGVQK